MPSSSAPDSTSSAHRSHSPVLGIGFPYLPGLPQEIYRDPAIDFVEVTPEGLCQERRRGSTVSLEVVPQKLEQARNACGTLPMVVHGVELSLGSAHGWNCAYLDMLDQFQAAWPFLWHSEHLGFQTIPDQEGGTLEIGVPLPLPFTREAVHLVRTRSAELSRRYRVPFLLENPAHYLTGLPTEPGIEDEIAFMNQITSQGGARQLLDLHNLYCNSINHRFDAIDAINRLDLDHVVEIHVAGGSWRDGFYMDAHDGCVPAQVWELLEYTLPRAPNVAGVVFEVLDRYAPDLGVPAIMNELARAQSIWRRRRTPGLQAA